MTIMSFLPSLFPVSLLLCFFCSLNEATTEFDFSTLAISNLKLLGDARLSNGIVSLTRDLSVPNSGAGKVLYANPIRFRQPGTHSPTSFSTFFSFSITNINPSSIGGGLAFVIAPDGNTIGAAGGSLGLAAPAGSKFVAVEFDTLMDVDFKDINSNHVGFDVNGVVSSVSGDLGTVDIDLKSGNTVNSWIEYDGLTRVFNVSVSYSNLKPKSPVLSFPLDLDRYVNDFMFVGFSGSTQGSTESHSIEWWSFRSSFGSGPGSGSGSGPSPPTANLVNPKANSVNSPPPIASQPSSSAVPVSSLSKTPPSSSCRNHLHDSFASEIIKAPKEFSYKELKAATRSFNESRSIGHGAFGVVYRGVLPETGDVVAVKRCSHSSQDKKNEFMSELSIIGSLRHRNLVRLQGWCHERGEILLVYDLMPNEGKVTGAADSRLEGKFDEGEMWRVMVVGLACSHPDPEARPTMRSVVQMLIGEADVPVVPKSRPTMSFSTSHLLLSLQDTLSDCNTLALNSSRSSSWSVPEHNVMIRGDDDHMRFRIVFMDGEDFTRKAAAEARGLNPGLIVLLVIGGPLVVFLVANIVLYVHAQKNLPPKKKKPVSKKKLKRERLKQGVSSSIGTCKTASTPHWKVETLKFTCAVLTSETEIEQFIHFDMDRGQGILTHYCCYGAYQGNEIDLSSLHKMSMKYAEAKRRAVKSAGEVVDTEDINHIAEEKELMSDRVEKLKEECDLQKLSFYEKPKLDGLDRTQKLLKDVENDEDDGFDELDRLLS
ncbi:hypothetical protein HID58_014376 [Brassica napus]|uniref:non-specific serine/threonine protein kinase n=1 Tax=Brassica napus TaxID=3708 RepID=A0ABQ8DGY3_BRANA|nr:hypothetical protein HID58_014376 [Brassica napus]